MEPTKPLSVRAALQAILDRAHFTAPIELVARAREALAEPFGLTVEQEPNYTVNAFGRIVNRATGVPIPDDEPVMIFRAKYVQRYQQFVTFAEQHPERMREPD